MSSSLKTRSLEGKIGTKAIKWGNEEKSNSTLANGIKT
jgi:hypothetical protein